MRITVTILDNKLRRFSPEVKRLSGEICSLFKKKGELEVFLIDSRRMRKLNRQFRGKNEPANVLSFVSPKNFPGAGLGEVYLNPIYIQKHNQDLTLMLTHGVLHIFGYDHKNKSDRIKMENKERQLMRKLR